jgi:hypothetical protein
MNTVHRYDIASLTKTLDADTVDMIFTDPPYDRASIPLYGQLAALASRVLKPGKFCLAMSGGLYQPEILSLMSAHLTYYWTFHVYLTGQNTGCVHPGGNHAPIITRVKPIHAFVKGWGSPRTVMQDPFGGSGNDKRFHHWGQDQQSARYYIDCFTLPGDVVLDPFCGGGTTPFAAHALARNYIAADVDEAAVEMTRNRLRNPLYIPARGAQLRMAFIE